MGKLNYLLFVFYIFISFCCQSCSPQKSFEEKIDDFFKKDNVKILVTDSGLGGISVAADVVSRMKDSGVFRKVEVIFFNAQPHEKSGYNSMKTTDQKVEVFDNALNAMEENFHPDLLLIACNTLSVLYDYTDFSKTAEFPVMGIVGTGVELIKQNMDEVPDSKVIIFATKTTVNQGRHKESLLKLGVGENNIITIPCPKLAGQIERGPESDTTKSLVKSYVKEAIEMLDSSNNSLFVSYNCTHYGYIDSLFRSTFEANNVQVKEFLDPNPLMADFMFTPARLNRFETTELSVRVVSQPELSPGKIGAIYGLIEPISIETAEALMEYEYAPDYFEWESIANRNQD
jgi:glutamate racemase